MWYAWGDMRNAYSILAENTEGKISHGKTRHRWEYNTVKSVLNGPFIKRNFVLNGNIFRSRNYHSIP
jgi:hypothetical protein